MCRYTNGNAVSDNVARDQSTQINVQIILGRVATKLHSSQPSEELLEKIAAFLQSSIPEIPPEMNGDRNTTTHHLGVLGSLNLRDTFPMLKESKDELSRKVHNYGHDRCSAIETLELGSRKELLTWLENPKSEILLIDTDSQSVDESWAIDLLLETGVMAATHLRHQINPSAIVIHLCPRSTKKDSGLEIVFQDLLVQIIEAHPERFVGLTVDKIHSAAGDPIKLQDLITRCIKQAQILTLFIFIHGIEEWYFENLKTSQEGDFKFAQDFTKFIRTLHDITVKTMVTSHLKTASDNFPEVMRIIIPSQISRYGRADD